MAVFLRVRTRDAESRKCAELPDSPFALFVAENAVRIVPEEIFADIDIHIDEHPRFRRGVVNIEQFVFETGEIERAVRLKRRHVPRHLVPEQSDASIEGLNQVDSGFCKLFVINGAFVAFQNGFPAVEENDGASVSLHDFRRCGRSFSETFQHGRAVGCGSFRCIDSRRRLFRLPGTDFRIPHAECSRISGENSFQTHILHAREGFRAPFKLKCPAREKRLIECGGFRVHIDDELVFIEAQQTDRRSRSGSAFENIERQCSRVNFALLHRKRFGAPDRAAIRIEFADDAVFLGGAAAEIVVYALRRENCGRECERGKQKFEQSHNPSAFIFSE